MKIKEDAPLYSRNPKHSKRRYIGNRSYSLPAVVILMIISIATFAVGVAVIDRHTERIVETSTKGAHTNVAKKTITESVELPYKTFKEVDPSLAKGETHIKVRGQNGIKNIVFEVTYEDGQEKSRSVLMEEIIEKPQDEIMLVGSN